MSGQQQAINFLQKFIADPKQVGSIVPSSRFLARKMADAVPWQEVRAIAELGSGTGVITKAIQPNVARGVQVMLFEKEFSMRSQLLQRYPDYAVYTDACHLDAAMRQEGIKELDCILSGLPFFNFTSEVRQTLIAQIQKALRPGGMFIAFQYSLQMRRLLEEAFNIERIGFELRNFPPAFVYMCRKRGPRR